MRSKKTPECGASSRSTASSLVSTKVRNWWLRSSPWSVARNSSGPYPVRIRNEKKPATRASALCRHDQSPDRWRSARAHGHARTASRRDAGHPRSAGASARACTSPARNLLQHAIADRRRCDIGERRRRRAEVGCQDRRSTQHRHEVRRSGCPLQAQAHVERNCQPVAGCPAPVQRQIPVRIGDCGEVDAVQFCPVAGRPAWYTHAQRPGPARCRGHRQLDRTGFQLIRIQNQGNPVPVQCRRDKQVDQDNIPTGVSVD